jgi:5-methylcytosine-specific restriction endonuclease McrA
MAKRGHKRVGEQWMIPRRAGEKFCRGCSQWLANGSFTKQSSSTDGLSYRCRACLAATHAARKDKHSACMREWYRRNKGEHLLRSRKWAEANRERMREYSRAWCSRHPDRVDNTDPEKRKASAARYRERHPDRVALFNKNSKLRRRQAPGRGVTPREWEAILAYFDHRCAYCFSASEKLSMDHVHPLALGGSHEPENVAPACARCNSSKWKKPLRVWLGIEQWQSA